MFPTFPIFSKITTCSSIWDCRFLNLYYKLYSPGLGTGEGTKTDEFSEKFRREAGGGVICNPKIYIADFWPLYRALKRVF